MLTEEFIKFARNWMEDRSQLVAELNENGWAWDDVGNDRRLIHLSSTPGEYSIYVIPADLENPTQQEGCYVFEEIDVEEICRIFYVEDLESFYRHWPQ